MRIDIDGKLATHFIYGFKELDALQHGGVQRIFTGNVPTGAHEIAVSVNGKTTVRQGLQQQRDLSFGKGVEPKLLGITLSGPESIQLGDW